MGLLLVFMNEPGWKINRADIETTDPYTWRQPDMYQISKLGIQLSYKY